MILPALHRWFAIVMLSGLLVPLSQAASDPAPQSLVEMFDNYQPAGGTIPVQIGMVIDEITAINQQAENFSVVGTLQLQWQQPDLAYEPESGEEAFRIFEGDDFDAYASDHHARLPRFTFFNQQGRRYSQNKLVVLMANGQANRPLHYLDLSNAIYTWVRNCIPGVPLIASSLIKRKQTISFT